MSRNHKPPKQRKTKEGKRRRLAVFSDAHGRPYMQGIARMLSDKPDLVIGAGDIHDLLAVSKFPKDVDIPIEEDVANVRAMVELIASQCELELCKGNHDDRLSRYFMDRIEARYMKLVDTDMLGWAVKNVPNAKIVNNLHGFTTSQGTVFPDVLSTSFLIFEGDAVFGHAEMARKGELNTVRGVYEWYDNWRRVLGWPEAAFFGQAHVHRAGLAYPSGGHRVLAELGAILEPSTLQYAMSGNASYSPPTIGYTILEQYKENGAWKTDLNSCHFTLC
jgi:predicted phosphodiesterase